MMPAANTRVSLNEANWLNDVSTITMIVEYMALGKTIVELDLHGGRVVSDETGLCATRNDAFSLAEGIIRLVDDAEMGTWMGQIGRPRLVTTRSWETQVAKLPAAYQQALDKGLEPIGCTGSIGEFLCG